MGVLGVGVAAAGRSSTRVGSPPVPPALLTAAGWAVGGAVTLAIALVADIEYAYFSPPLHLVLDSVDGCIALLVAYLLGGRFRRTRYLRDLLLAESLLVLAVAGLGSTLVLGLTGAVRPGNLGVWVLLALRVSGAVLMAAAALVGQRTVRERATRVAASPLLLLALVVALLWLLGDGLPQALGATPPRSAQRPVVEGHPVLLGAQAVTGLCFALASLSFTRSATRDRHDELLRWLGAACALAGFARVNYLLFPSLYSSYVYAGDVLRTACYLLLLVGAAREISQYWSSQAQLAVLEDRRRLARELHDGVVQEVAYIRAEAHEIQEAKLRRAVLGACDRALDEARAAVDAMGSTADEPLGFVLHRAARQVTERYGGVLEVDVDDSLSATHEQLHALVRITREAVANALRHGKAQHVSLRLWRDAQGSHLVVRDDGRGFDVGAVRRRSTGFGLTSMRERAEALPGRFRLESAPGAGAEVRVTWG